MKVHRVEHVLEVVRILIKFGAKIKNALEVATITCHDAKLWKIPLLLVCLMSSLDQSESRINSGFNIVFRLNLEQVSISWDVSQAIIQEVCTQH